MKKSIVIILIGAVVLGAGAYFLSQNKPSQPSTEPQQQEQANEQQETDDQETMTGSLKRMLGLERSLKCSWSNEGGSGTTWVKNGMFYNEVTDGTQQARVIFKDDCMWSWQEGKAQGVKMCFSPEEADEIISGESSESQETDQQQATDESVPTDVQYNCRPATVSDAKFDPPEDIQFMDVDQLMQGMQE